MILNIIAVQIRAERDFLSEAHPLHLALFEVGIHPDFVQWHDSHQRRAGINAHAKLNRPLRHIAADRSHDGAAGVVEIALTEGGDGTFNFRVAVDYGVIHHGHIGAQRFLSGQKIALRAGDRIAVMRQVFRGDRPALEDFLPPRIVVLRRL